MAIQEKRLLLMAVVVGCALSLQSCELFFELGELDVAAGAGADVAAAGEFASGAAEFRALATELPLDASVESGASLRTVLERGAEETAAGRTITITSEGEILARGRTWGRLTDSREIVLRRPGSTVETPVGKLSNGLIWAPDEGGNLLPIARIQGVLKPLSYGLRSGVNGSATGTILSRDMTIDILRLRDGWYEVRVAGKQATGWIRAASLSVVMLATSRTAKVADAILTCAEQDSATGSGQRMPRPQATDAQYSLHLVLRYPRLATSKANEIARSLQQSGFQVVRQIVDVPSTETCGGEIYYHRDDFQAARSLQGMLAPIERLRISSFSIDESRMLIWLR
jgi:hypothetical protein